MAVNQRVVGQLEHLDISLNARTSLILTYLGLKPAAHFELWGHSYNYGFTPVQNIPKNVVASLAETLRETGLPFQIKPPYYHTRSLVDALAGGSTNIAVSFLSRLLPVKDQTQAVYYAKDEMLLERLVRADPSRDHTKYGRLMGYPETAIQAFNGELERLACFPDETIPPSLRIVLSKQHYKEELELLKHWNDSIRKTAPFLYKEMTARQCH